MHFVFIEVYTYAHATFHAQVHYRKLQFERIRCRKESGHVRIGGQVANAAVLVKIVGCHELVVDDTGLFIERYHGQIKIVEIVRFFHVLNSECDYKYTV